jgi:hypothetical protein
VVSSSVAAFVYKANLNVSVVKLIDALAKPLRKVLQEKLP